MKLIDMLRCIADEEILRLKPLPKHYLADKPEHLRRNYALLISAVLTAQPMISESQSRLLRLLLDSLELGDIRGALFEQARALTPETLLEAARLTRKEGIFCFFTDILVLLRIDNPINEEATQLIEELSAIMDLPESSLKHLATITTQILDLNIEKEKIIAASKGLSTEELRKKFENNKEKHEKEIASLDPLERRFRELREQFYKKQPSNYKEFLDNEMQRIRAQAAAWPDLT